MIVVFPADVLRPRRVDEHFAGEFQAARDAGFDVGLVDHDALTRPGGAAGAVATVGVGVPAGNATREAVYRGWMLRSERYADFAAALAARGVRPRTSAEQYRLAHELPGWYEALAEFTPRSVWTTDTSGRSFDHARAMLGAGPAVLRDYCKSMKHHWHEAAFIPDLTDASAAGAVASRFRELRDDDLVGGFVLRAFESFTGAEVRTWWVDGECRLVTAHPDTPDSEPDDIDLSWLRPTMAGLGLPFVTVDLAIRTDGVWRVVELGDGQVSDRPASTPPAEIIALLGAAGR